GLNKLVRGIVQEAVTAAQVLTQYTQNQIFQQIQPHIQFAEQQRNAVLADQYFSKNPNHRGLDPLIQAVHQQLLTEKFRAQTPQQLFDEVAKRVDELVNQLGVNPQGQGQQGQQSAMNVHQVQSQQAPTQQTRMSTLTRGGQGGTGAPSNSGSSKQSTAQRLFG